MLISRQQEIHALDGADYVTHCKEITSDVLDTCMGKNKWRTRLHKHLTFQDAYFNLGSLDGLLEQPIDLTQLETLDVSNNSLGDLAAVEGKSRRLDDRHVLQGSRRFSSLKVLKARHNSLQNFIAVLPLLRELDLGHNRLPRLPLLSGMPQLEVLILSHNQMEGKWHDIGQLEHLKKLDLSDNHFEFQPTDFGKQLDELAKLEQLTSIRLKDNPFTRFLPEYQAVTLNKLRGLRKLDDINKSEDMESARKLAQNVSIDNLAQYDYVKWIRERAVKGKVSSMPQGKEEEVEAPIPRLQELADVVLEAMEDASLVPKAVQRLGRFCDAIAARLEPKYKDTYLHQFDDFVGNDKEEVEGQIGAFLSDITILLGRVGDHMKVMLLRAMAKLSAVHKSGLGERCIQHLGWLSKRDPDMEHDIFAVVKELILEPLISRDMIHPATDPVVRGLSRFESDKLPDVLQPITEWLVRMYCAGGGMGNRSITHLLAVATTNRTNAEEALKMDAVDGGGPAPAQAGVREKLTEVVLRAHEDKTFQGNESWRGHYLNILKIITNIARLTDESQYRDVIETYKAKKLHESLKRVLVARFGENVTDHIEHRDNRDSKKRVIDLSRMTVLDLQTCGALIDTIAALMTNSEGILKDLMDDSGGNVPIVEYLVRAPRASPVADPTLLASSLKCIHVILQIYRRTGGQGRQQVVANIIRELHQLKPMLELINPSSRSYKELFSAAHRHLSELGQGMKKGETQYAQAPVFKNLTNPLMHQCFETIVLLIDFFLWHSKDDKKLQEVSKVLDENNRDRLLFALLEVPSDPVKEAVMSCFDHIEFSQLSSEEVGYLVHLVETQTDVGSHESLLEKVIQTLSTLAGDHRDAGGHSKGAGTALRTDHAERAVNAVVLILLENSKRETYGVVGETKQKNSLSLACVKFLQIASNMLEPRSRNMYIRSKKVNQSFIDILRHEDLYSQWHEPDLMVECTWAGRSVEALLVSISGKDSLDVRGKVGFRVLARMADILEGGGIDTQTGGERRERVLQDVTQEERNMWDESAIKARICFLDDHLYRDYELQQSIFGQYNGLERIVEFLSGLIPESGDTRVLTRKREVVLEEAAEAFLADTQQRAVDNFRHQFRQRQRENQSGQRLLMLEGVQQLALLGVPERDGHGSDFSKEADICNEYAGQLFDGVTAEDGVDLRQPPHSWQGTLGGAFSVLVKARWDVLHHYSRIIDFGSGAPQDNIIIGNQAMTNNLIFHVYQGDDGTNGKLTVPGGIQVGRTSEYLFAVNLDGHMKIYRDGLLIGEKVHGLVPHPVRRNGLYVGKSHWEDDEPFHGEIKDLKVWYGKAMDWETAHEDENDDDVRALQEEKPDRCYFMKSLFDVSNDVLPIKKPDLLGATSGAPLMGEEFIISEDFSVNGQINVAYVIAAALRCCFAMLRMPSSESIREKMVESIRGKLMVSRLLTLVDLCRPFDCFIAAKLLKLMSQTLELPPSKTIEQVERVVVYDILQGYYAKLCRIALSSIKQQEDVELAKRGRVLSTEIVQLASVICRTVAHCSCSEEKLVQAAFVESCLERLMPLSVIKALVEMMMRDSQEPQEQGSSVKDSRRKKNSAPHEIWELSRVVLAQVLNGCVKMKYDILAIFSNILASGSGPLRETFLSSLLSQSQQGAELHELDVYFNSETRAERPSPLIGESWGIDVHERALGTGKVEAFLDGTKLIVANRSHGAPCLICVLTNRGLYIMDLTAAGHPERPRIVYSKEHSDVTRLVKGHVSQVLYVGLATGTKDNLSEEFMTMVCHRERDRNELLGKLHALSSPDGKYDNRALLQYDKLFVQALQTQLSEAVLVTSFVLQDGELQLLALSEGRLHLFQVAFDKWLPPAAEEIFVDDAADELADDLEVVGSLREVNIEAEGNRGHLSRSVRSSRARPGRDRSKQDTAEHAREIAAKRKRARKSEESSKGRIGEPGTNSKMEKARDALLRRLHSWNFEGKDGINKLRWVSEKEAKLELEIGGEVSAFIFLDDMTMANWRHHFKTQMPAAKAQESKATSRRS